MLASGKLPTDGADGADGATFVDRGDPSSHDFVKTDLTIDWAWHELDLSSIVGAANRLVLLRLEVRSTAGDEEFQFRTKGIADAYNLVRRRTYLANTTCYMDVWVYTDASGIIEYKIVTDTWGTFNITVKGWFEL